jgi:riboflavin biosynthesis pyrimidine reductase
MTARIIESTDDAPVDLVGLVESETRGEVAGRPWVMANTIMSLDGATTVAGRSGGLGGTADRQHFSALRQIADAILVGVNTAVTEGYRLPVIPADVRQRRMAHGRWATPRLAVVSHHARFQQPPRFLTSTVPVTDDDRAILLTTARAADGDVGAIENLADVVIAGARDVDMRAALDALHERGARLVLCEGGSALLGQLACNNLVDEWFVTVAPRAIGGDAHRMLASAAVCDLNLELDRVLMADGFLLLRYFTMR